MLSRVYYIEGFNTTLNDFVRANLSDWALDAPFELLPAMPGWGDLLLCGVSRDGKEEPDTFLSLHTADLSPVEFRRQFDKLLSLDTLQEAIELPIVPLKRCCEPEAPLKEKCGSANFFSGWGKKAKYVAESLECGGAAEVWDTAPEQVEDVREQFMAELQRRLRELSDEGVHVFLQTFGNDFLQNLQNLAPKPLSRVVIDNQFRVLLPDYDLEIKMNALWRAIYILFIRHEEGIVLKDIGDYRAELAAIYKRIASGEYERVEATINDVTTPGSDNFRQYLSKINHAFNAALPADIAQHYIIFGRRGESYRIRLSRDQFDLSSALL